jgi:hypothetical protein
VAHTGIRRFVIRGLLFTLPIILVLGYVEFRLRAIPNSYNLKRVFLEKQLDSIEVLALGSSQTYNGINPAFFALPGFNLGDVGQTIFYDVRLAEKYIDRMPHLRCVVIALSYFSFGYDLDRTGEAWREYYYYRFWNVRAGDIRWYDSRCVSFIALYTPKTVLRFALHGFAVNEAPGMQYNGWNRLETTEYESISDSLGRERVRIHDIVYDPSCVDGNFRSLVAFLENLRSRGIAVVLTTPPVYSTYAKFMNPKTVAENRRYIDSLCVLFGCRYFDFSTDKRFAITDFNDNDHLNFTGAEKFSKILNDTSIAHLSSRR